MNLRNIYMGDYRAVRAVQIDNTVPVEKNEKSFGTFIEEQIQLILGKFSANAKGYKVEDDGILAGYYIVDYSLQGMPFVPVFAIRSAYEESREIITQQIQQWSAQEYIRQASN